MTDQQVEDALNEAFDVVYCFDEEERRRLRSPEVIGSLQAREEARAELRTRLDEMLPEIHGLYASGIRQGLQVTGEMMDHAPNLEVIGGPGSGAEFVDAEAATERGIYVVNAAGAGYIPVAEHVLGMMISLSKGIHLADRWMRAQKRWPLQFTDIRPGPEVTDDVIDGKTLAIIGFGFIGREIAYKCRVAFNMRILVCDPYFDPVEAQRQGVRLVDTPIEILPEADFVTVNVPLNRETRHIIGERELRAMKRTAFLINTSRGGTVDPDALLRACNEEWIAGAGLDVFDPEPLTDNHPFFEAKNTVITPHSAGQMRGLASRLARATAREMTMALRGERPWHLVNPKVPTRPGTVAP
jgi:phosphoglycerate dehydrogenase-like enzyme